MPAKSSTACTRPSSPAPPWSARKTTSTSRMSEALLVRASADSRMFARAVVDGGSGPTPLVSIFFSASAVSLPVTVSIAMTSCPRPRSAGMIWAALAIETSRSWLVPPKRTAIFMLRILTPTRARVYERFRRQGTKVTGTDRIGRPASSETTGSERVVPRRRLDRDPAQLGKLVHPRFTAESAVTRGLHAPERHLCLIVYRRTVDMADPRFDAPGELDASSDVAGEERRRQAVFRIICGLDGLLG